MALTLAEAARLEKAPLKKFVLMNLLRYSDLFSLIPFEKVSELSNIVVRWDTLPTVAFRKIGGSYTANEGSTEQVTEGIYALGGDVEHDRIFDFTKNYIKPPMRVQMEMKSKAISYKFNDALINGDHATDVDSFEGVNKRIASYLPARQSISIGSAFDPTASDANMHKLIDYLHELIDLAGLRKAPMVKLGGGNGQPVRSGALLMNRGTYLGIGRILRRQSLLDTTKDSFGREFRMFDDIPLIDVGLKEDQSTEIITDGYGGGSNETRIFAVRFGDDDGLIGIQMNTPDPYDPLNGGEKEAGPQKLMRIDWYAGLAGFGSYYAARLTGLLKSGSWT